MGLYADNYERFISLPDGEFPGRRFLHLGPFVAPLPAKSCPYCAWRGKDDAEVQRHIKVVHDKQCAYLLVNGRVVRTWDQFNGDLTEFDVVATGYQGARCTVSVGRKQIFSGVITGECSLLEHVCRFPHGPVEVVLEGGGPKMEFTVYRRDGVDIRNSDIDESAVRHLFRPLDRAREPSWKAFKEECARLGATSEEESYIDGLHDYALAFYLAQQGKEARMHFETAFRLLRVFGTGFAQTARRTLGFRMNLFQEMKCDETSVFFCAYAFFSDPARPWRSRRTYRAQSRGVFLDRFTEAYLVALEAYYGGDCMRVLSICTDDLAMVSGMNAANAAKVALLHARTARRMGDMEAARMYYQRLSSDPLFEGEAKEVLSERTA